MAAIFDDTAITKAGNLYLAQTNIAAVQFTISETVTITEYKASLQDLNGTGSMVLQMYTDSSNSIGSAITGTDVSVGHASISDASEGIVTFTLGTPKTGVTAGTYWLKLTASSGAAFLGTYQYSPAGNKRILIDQTTYYDNCYIAAGVWGTVEAGGASIPVLMYHYMNH